MEKFLVAGLVVLVASCTTTREVRKKPKPRKARVAIHTWQGGPNATGKNCVAEPPQQGVIDTRSRNLSRLDIWRGKRAIKEEAVMRKPPMQLEVLVGGCMEYTANYKMTFKDETPISNKLYYLTKGLTLIDLIPHKPKGSAWHLTIAEAIRPNLTDSEQVQKCSFGDANLSSKVTCSVKRIKSKVQITLNYTIALAKHSKRFPHLIKQRF